MLWSVQFWDVLLTLANIDNMQFVFMSNLLLGARYIRNTNPVSIVMINQSLILRNYVHASIYELSNVINDNVFYQDFIG